MIAGAQHPSACKQRYLENVGDSWCVRDNTHAPTRQIFPCQRDALARKQPARSSRAARTLVTSSKSGSYVSLLCNFNNRILRPSRKMADHSKTECPATRRNPLPVARRPRRDVLSATRYDALRHRLLPRKIEPSLISLPTTGKKGR